MRIKPYNPTLEKKRKMFSTTYQSIFRVVCCRQDDFRPTWLPSCHCNLVSLRLALAGGSLADLTDDYAKTGFLFPFSLVTTVCFLVVPTDGDCEAELSYALCESELPLEVE